MASTATRPADLALREVLKVHLTKHGRPGVRAWDGGRARLCVAVDGKIVIIEARARDGIDATLAKLSLCGAIAPRPPTQEKEHG